VPERGSGSPARLVLASGSPRRAAILNSLGIPFRVDVSDVPEDLLPGERAEDAAARLAQAKAAAVASDRLPVLAADTLVVCQGAILGKPKSCSDAARMLRLLSGRTHDVVTAVCLRIGGRVFAGLARTQVEFAPMSEADIEWYVATGEPMDKAGAYHVDGRGALFVCSLSGSPSNVAGLPVRVVLDLVREAGIDIGFP
jgi:septum formation protein